MINRLIANILPYMPKKLIWIFSQRYIAGETIEDGIRASKELNGNGDSGNDRFVRRIY
jgi:proline dehydrogenase